MVQMGFWVSIKCVHIRRHLLRVTDYDVELKDHGFCNSVTSLSLIDLFMEIRL